MSRKMLREFFVAKHLKRLAVKRVRIPQMAKAMRRRRKKKKWNLERKAFQKERCRSLILQNGKNLQRRPMYLTRNRGRLEKQYQRIIVMQKMVDMSLKMITLNHLLRSLRRLSFLFFHLLKADQIIHPLLNRIFCLKCRRKKFQILHMGNVWSTWNQLSNLVEWGFSYWLTLHDIYLSRLMS